MLELLDVTFAVKQAEAGNYDYCKRGSVLANAIADAKADAIKGHCGPSHVERLLFNMNQSGGNILHLQFKRVDKDGNEVRVQGVADAMLESMKERFPALPVIAAMTFCCRPSAPTSPGVCVCVCLSVCVCVCVCARVCVCGNCHLGLI